MSSKNSRLRVAFLAVALAAAGLALAGPAAAATPQAATVATTQQTPAIPVDFVDLATGPLAADGESHEVTLTYRNDSAADRTVAPQLLVESPDSRPVPRPDGRQGRAPHRRMAAGRPSTSAARPAPSSPT